MQDAKSVHPVKNLSRVIARGGLGMIVVTWCVVSTISCGPQKPLASVPAPSATAVSPHQEEIENLLEEKCAEWRNLHFKVLHDPFNTVLASLEVPQSSVPSLLNGSRKLPSHNELKNRPQLMAFMKQFERAADWWRPSKLENAKFADRSDIIRREDDPHFEFLTSMTVAVGAPDGGWVRIYICSQGEIVPRPPSH
jgi:hypothetical protein